MKHFLIRCRVSFEGQAYVEAADEDEATAKFEKGEFDFDTGAASLADWTLRHVEEVS